MPKSLDQLRRDARTLARSHARGESHACRRLAAIKSKQSGSPFKHADYLHVIAREQGFASWPALKLDFELHGIDRAEKRQRLKTALAYGQAHIIDKLFADDPRIAEGDFALEIASLNRKRVEAAILAEPQSATRLVGGSPPLVILCESRYFQHLPSSEDDMVAIAELLFAYGADPNQGRPMGEDVKHTLSPLYFATGHANNMTLARWLLEHGADPNDGESLYHSTELGHHEGLKLLLNNGADPIGTNALLRAMDFHDTEAVKILLEAGARVDDFDDTFVGGERPWVIPALHQAARRMSRPDMISTLLEAGGDPNSLFEGHSA